MPLGLCYVAEFLTSAGHDVSFVDLCFARKPSREIANAVRRFSPEVVGVSIRNIDNCVGTNSRFVLEDVARTVITPLQEVFRGPIITGGSALGVSAQRILSLLNLEVAVRGDGERAMGFILERLQHGHSLSGIPGVVLRQGGHIVEDNDPERSHELDDLPWPRVYRHVNVAAYRRFHSPLQVQSKRGCSLDCSYCTYNVVEGRAYRLRDPEQIADEIADMTARTGVRHIEFVDSTFNIPLDHAKAVLRALIIRGLKLELRTMGLNPGAMDEELVDLMFRAGFRDVDLGAESGSDTTLAGLAKNFRREDLFQTGRLLRERGISAHWFLILGGPGESRETALETFATMEEVAAPWDVVGFNVGLRLYSGAPLAERVCRENPACTTDGFLSPVFYEPDGIALADLRRLASEEVAKRANFMLYDEVDLASPWSTRAVAVLFDVMRFRGPHWKALIAARKVRRFLSLS